MHLKTFSSNVGRASSRIPLDFRFTWPLIILQCFANRCSYFLGVFQQNKSKKRRNQDELDHRFLAFSFLYLSLAQLFFVHKIFIDSLAVRFGSQSCCKMHVFDTDYSILYIFILPMLIIEIVCSVCNNIHCIYTLKLDWNNLLKPTICFSQI